MAPYTRSKAKKKDDLQDSARIDQAGSSGPEHQKRQSANAEDTSPSDSPHTKGVEDSDAKESSEDEADKENIQEPGSPEKMSLINFQSSNDIQEGEVDFCKDNAYNAGRDLSDDSEENPTEDYQLVENNENVYTNESCKSGAGVTEQEEPNKSGVGFENDAQYPSMNPRVVLERLDLSAFRLSTGNRSDSGDSSSDTEAETETEESMDVAEEEQLDEEITSTASKLITEVSEEFSNVLLLANCAMASLRGDHGTGVKKNMEVSCKNIPNSNVEPCEIMSFHAEEVIETELDPIAAIGTQASNPQKRMATDRIETEIPPKGKSIDSHGSQVEIIENSSKSKSNPSNINDTQVAAETQASPNTPEQANHYIRYLPHIQDLLQVFSGMKFEDAKRKLADGKFDLNNKSAVLLKRCCKALNSFDYKSMLKESLINKEHYELLSPGVYEKVITAIPPKILVQRKKSEISNPEWERACDLMDESIGPSVDRQHPVLLAHANEGDDKRKLTGLFKAYFEHIKQNPNHETYTAELKNFETIKPVLENGLETAVEPPDARRKYPELFTPHFQVTTALASTPIRSDYGFDGLHVLRHGEPQYWIVWRAEGEQEFVRNLYDRLRNTMEICEKILEHNVITMLDEVIRDTGIHCVLFRQEVGDAVYIKPGAYYARISIGVSLMESRNFSSPLCYVAKSARSKPCRCLDEKYGDISLNKNVRIKYTLYRRQSPECRICKIPFDTIIACNLHMHALHGEEYYYQCLECGKSYPVKSKLTRHKASHIGIKVQCEVCEVFVSNIDSHKKMHYPNVTCENCLQEFSYRVMKEKHSKVCKKK